MSGDGIRRTKAGTYQGRYRDRSGKQHSFTRRTKAEAVAYRARKLAEISTGVHLAPSAEKVTVGEWAERWLEGHKAGRRDATVRQASTHLQRITAHFGHWPLGAVRPNDVKVWVASLEQPDAQGRRLAESYVYALHSRLSQLYSDAIHEGLTARNPCSRKTSPPAPKQRPFVCTLEQVQALEAAMPEHLRPVVLLGAWVGLRVGEVCGLRSTDLDPDAGTLRVEAQWTGEELKTQSSRATMTLGPSLAKRLAEIHDPSREWLLVNQWGDQLQPRVIQREWREARAQVPGLPDDFRFHDLRHFLASYLIANGADIKAVQARMRHASATVTLNVYSHLLPQAADASVAMIEAALAPTTGQPLATPGAPQSTPPAVAEQDSPAPVAVRERGRRGHLRAV